MMPVLDVDLTDPLLYTNGFPHDVFTVLPGKGTRFLGVAMLELLFYKVPVGQNYRDHKTSIR